MFPIFRIFSRFIFSILPVFLMFSNHISFTFRILSIFLIFSKVPIILTFSHFLYSSFHTFNFFNSHFPCLSFSFSLSHTHTHTHTHTHIQIVSLLSSHSMLHKSNFLVFPANVCCPLLRSRTVFIFSVCSCPLFSP